MTERSMEEKTKYDPTVHGRHTTRMYGIDYSNAGFYFITICTQGRKRLFGHVGNGEMRLNNLGRIVSDEWEHTFVVRPYVQRDEFVVMPDHMHMIVHISDGNHFDDALHQTVGATRRVAPTGPPKQSIGAIVGQFKSKATKRIHFFAPDINVWQRNFHDRILRDPEELEYYRMYIRENPKRWEKRDLKYSCKV